MSLHVSTIDLRSPIPRSGERLVLDIEYEIDTWDWGCSCERERQKCEDGLAEWFEGLSLKNQLGIFYSQYYWDKAQGGDGNPFDAANDGCPFHDMVYAAVDRIFEKNFGDRPHTGYNLSLHTIRATTRSVPDTEAIGKALGCRG